MDPLMGLYSLVLAQRMAGFVHDAAALVTFHRMLTTNPTGSVEDLEAEKQRMMDELYIKLSAIEPSKDSAGLALKQALIFFSEQL